VESIAKPLRRLQEEASWFARASEVRLLWVTTPASLRSAALSALARLEYHADNQSPFIALEAPWSGPDTGAPARSEQFFAHFSRKAQDLRAAGVDVGAFPVSPRVDADLSPWSRWARDLTEACAALRLPLRGLVVVLAPSRVDDAPALVAQLRALLDAPVLEDVRWIVIESDTRHLAPLLEKLGRRHGLSVDISPDEAEQQRDLAALVGPARAGATARLPHPWGPWASAGAMPGSAPPPRVGEPEPPSDEQLLASGLEPAYVKGGGLELQRLMLSGALAQRQGRTADAIEWQRCTAELCGHLKLHREQVIHLLVLGGYLLAASRPERARAAYRTAGQLAAEKQLAMQHAQAELGLGLLDALEQQPEAAQHYAAAGRLAEMAELPALALECWRMAGQAASEGLATSRAIECWQHGLTLAEALPPEAARATSAAVIARLLAHAHATRGQSAAAEQLHRQASRLEQGVGPEPAREIT
jgi:hypothetical protein